MSGNGGRSTIRSCMPIASRVLTNKGLVDVEPRLPRHYG
jgi:hypothetical protein